MTQAAQLPLGDLLPDEANEADTRRLAIDRVGIRGLSYPIRVLDKNNEAQHTVAEIDAYVGLPHHFKGTHMSRFVEILNSVRGEMTVRNLPSILREVQRRLEAEDAYIEVKFPYFITKSAPVSKAESLMEYQSWFTATAQGRVTDFVLGVEVPVKSLCPCSKAISERGAHNQRSLIRVEVRSTEFLWLEDIIERVEACGSSPLYALLKREDEKFVTEAAYDNPKFVEDLVRDVVISIRELPGVTWMRVTADNHESIHKHSAFAEIEWKQEPEDSEQLAMMYSVPSSKGAFDFGSWLRQLRSERNISQTELASAVEVSPSFLSRVESGDKAPSPELVERLSAHLGLDATTTMLRAGIMDETIQRAIASQPERFLRWLAL